jgi:hypothetical protein
MTDLDPDTRVGLYFWIRRSDYYERGHVVVKASPGHYLVELAAEHLPLILVAAADMAKERWRFYEDEQEMHDNAEEFEKRMLAEKAAMPF